MVIRYKRAAIQVASSLPAIITPVKVSKQKGGYISCMNGMEKGKCACGKLIDQANSLISFVSVIV